MLKYEEKEFCKVHLEYSPTTEIVEEKREQALNEVFKESKNITLKGFRKGKASVDAIKLHFRANIEENIKQKLISQAMDEYVFESKAKTIFYPQIISLSLRDNNFNCELVVLKQPDFTLNQYKDFEIPKPHISESASEMVEKALQTLRVQYGDVISYQEGDFVQVGDKVTLDMKCLTENKTIEEFTKEGVLYEVGSGLYRDIDDNILGMMPGEERYFNTVFDQNTGEKATFTIFVHMGVKTVPCALDDELAKKVGMEDFKQLRAYLDGESNKQVKNTETQQIQQQIVQRLLVNHDFEVPEFLINAESEQLAIKFGTKFNDLDDDTKVNIRTRAKDMVKLTLILNAIREQEPEMTYSESEIIEKLRTQLSSSGKDANKLLVEAQNSGQLAGMIAGIQHQATMEWLVSHSKIME